MKSDEQLKRDVESELHWDVSLNDSGIIVAADAGVVSLGGHVPFYADKVAAEKAVKNVIGVRAVVNDIDVKPGTEHRRADGDIAEAALGALNSSVSIPAARIKVIVRDGWITLEGSVPYRYQKATAETAMQTLWGVKGITNSVTIEPSVSAGDVRSKIQSAFQRHAVLDANKLSIDVLDNTVTLSGKVHSWHEKDDAETAAWSAPGVKSVKNNLSVTSL